MNLQGSYQFQYRFSDSDRSMYDLHKLLEDISEIHGYMPLTKEQLYMGYIPGVDTLNRIQNWENSQYATYNEYNHDAQLLLRYTRKFENQQELRFNFGASFQPQTTHMEYKKDRLDTTVVRNVFNWAPRIHARWKINQGSQLQFRYNGRMSQPSMTNLLEVMDNTNPQNVSLGNAGLKSSWTNNIRLNYNAYLQERQMGWAANLSYTYTHDDVINVC
jgi:outer membrane receptor protein involved in Fe transport